MYRTLTLGFGQMPPQTWMVPRQKYDVIHYIREAYLKPHNPSQYVAGEADLPRRAAEGDEPRARRRPRSSPGRRWTTARACTRTYEIGDDGDPNIAYKGIAVRLDPGPGGVSRGRAWAVFEHDTLRVAAGWTGPGFIDWNGINFNGQHAIHPRDRRPRSNWPSRTAPAGPTRDRELRHRPRADPPRRPPLRPAAPVAGSVTRASTDAAIG